MVLDKKKYILISLCITVMYSMPFLLSPYNFLDDFYRSSNGDLVSWFSNARPFSVFFFRFVNASLFPSDPYPFSFIFSFIILYCITLYTVNKIVTVNNFLIKLSVFILFLCNPFLLQNLSYKYDCIMMVMSIVCACIFVFKRQSNLIYVDYIERSLLIFALLCFYQSALSLLFGLLSVKMLVDSEENDLITLIIDMVIKLFIVILVFFIYKIFIADLLLTKEFTKVSKIISFDNKGLYQLFINIQDYFSLLGFFILKKYILFSSVLLLSVFIYVSATEILQKKYKYCIISVLCMPLLLIALTSSNIVLSTPLIHMREMMGVSSVFIFLFLFVQKKELIRKVTLVLPCSFLLTSFLISSAMCNLKRAEFYKNELVVQDILRSIYYFGVQKVEGINIISDDLQSPAEKIILKNYPMLNYLFDHQNFSKPWYANGILNGQYYLHKIIMDDHLSDFPKNVDYLSGCYTKTALEGVILYVKVGSYCSSFPKGYNAGIF